MQYVIFDFNGTILNDVDLAVKSLNKTIAKYLDRDPISIEDYKKIFKFPVKKYYEDVGFNFDVLNWEEVGKFWADDYNANFKDADLYEGIIELLKSNKEKGIKNICLSATRVDLLNKQLEVLGIKDYFDEILGIDNIYATSKVNVGLDFIKDKDKNECIMIGDTTHDKEVADAMGIKCVLCANGHQPKETLEKISDNVIDDIREFKI